VNANNKKIIKKVSELIEIHDDMYDTYVGSKELQEKIDLMRKDLILHHEIILLSDKYTREQKEIILETIDINEKFIAIVKKAFDY